MSGGNLSNRLRPRLFVLDDLSRFVALVDGYFVVAGARVKETEARIYGNQANALGCAATRERIQGFCGVLNKLSERFDVAVPVLWTDAAAHPGYEHAARVLPFHLFDLEWPSAAAFLVTDDWRPALRQDQSRDGRAWTEFGNVLVHLLTRRYPDLPCLLMTSNWSLRKLQDGLAHGAAWCVGKSRSSEELHGYELTAPVLTDRLNADADLRYGAFRDNPFSGQFEPDRSTEAGRKLLQRLGLTSPIVRSLAGRDLQRSMATLFPHASRVEPVLVLGYGRSAASATFFVRTESASGVGATRFVKIGVWPMIQRESLAFRRVIHPYLNSHVAGMLARPVGTVGTNGRLPSGAIAYSLAGFPEGYRSLRSLYVLLEEARRKPAFAATVAEVLRRTLDRVVRPLHETGVSGQGGKLPIRRRPLWHWLGSALPPGLTGELVDLSTAAEARHTPCLVSHRESGYKQDVAWLLAAADLADAASPVSAAARGDRAGKEGGAPQVRFQGFPLSDVSWQGGAEDQAEVVLTHPDLGLRVGLRGRASKLDDGLRTLWARPGLLMDVVARIDAVNQKYDAMDERIAGSLAACGLGGDEPRQAFTMKYFASEPFVDPLLVLNGAHSLPWSYTIEAHEGSTHGDLNLQNVLFPDEASDTGWLIDFERAEEHGMPAFDLAKLEMEILQHHVMPEVERIANAFMLEPAERVLLWWAVLRARDQQELTEGVLANALRTLNLRVEYEAGSFATVLGLIRVVNEIRAYARRLGLTGTEMDWALGAYALVATKFPSEPWRVVWLWLTSGWHLRRVVPGAGSEQHPSWGEVASQVAHGRIAPSGAVKSVDEMLLLAGRSPPDMLTLTQALALVPDERRPVWPEPLCERWDVASTGSVANITPILGYLWLMARLADESGSVRAGSLVVPKVSSKGKSCGTVDILASGGLSFPSGPALIVERSLREGGVLCQQSDDLTPVDALVMRRRRATNRMKDALLTVTSVLAKKLTMGCTHVVVDVKLGRDTKFLAPWLPAEHWRRFLTPGAAGLIAGDHADALGALFVALGAPADSVEIQATSGGYRYLRQCFDEDFGSLKQAVWLPTNADVPQCRAVGRHLMLLHLDGLICGKYDWAGDCGSETLLEQPAYAQLYREVLPELCGIAKPDWADLREPWEALKTQLPRLPGIVARACPERWLTGAELERVYALQDLTDDLAVVSLGAESYCGSDSAGARLRSVDAYALDDLFERLCGENPYDEEVGVWLHRLPGEFCGGQDVPFISVFFRPSRTPAQTVLQWLREFLYSNVQLEMP